MKNLFLSSTFITLTFLIPSKSLAQSDKDQVKSVMLKYKNALESLDLNNTASLFIKQSQVVESGKVEGTYKDYFEHHIGPELAEFSSFKYNDYSIQVEVNFPFAFTTESYIYKIILKKDQREIKRKGVATTVLKKVDGGWNILRTHISSRAVKKP